MAYGGEEDTTISRMELKAVIMGLIEIGIKYGPTTVSVRSDSEYVVKGASDKSRKRNLNNDLWDLLDDCEEAHTLVTYQHVRGHSGHEHNELADKLAGQGRKETLSGVRTTDQ